MFSRIKSQLRAFRDETHGSISVEFMLILPLLFWWYTASFAFFDGFRSQSNAVKSSYMISDILSRQIQIDNDYLDGLESLLEYMTRTDDGVWMRVTSIQYSSYQGYKVEWSYSTSAQPVLTTEQLSYFDIDDNVLPVMAAGETVILSETYVPYSPFRSTGFMDRTWKNILVTRPRFTSQIDNEDF